MTEAVASDLIANAPLTPDAARARISERMADPEFRERYLKKEEGAFKEFTALHNAMFPPPPQSVEDVNNQAITREAQQQDSRISALLKLADLPQSAQDEIRRGQPIAASEQKWAREEIARLKRDKEFVRRLMDGDRRASTDWTRLHQIITLPTAKSATTYPVK